MHSVHVLNTVLNISINVFDICFYPLLTTLLYLHSRLARANYLLSLLLNYVTHLSKETQQQVRLTKTLLAAFLSFVLFLLSITANLFGLTTVCGWEGYVTIHTHIITHTSLIQHITHHIDVYYTISTQLTICIIRKHTSRIHTTTHHCIMYYTILYLGIKHIC